MSPTNPSDQSAQEKLEREFEDFLQNDSSRVAAAYRKLPRSEPASALDLRVRARAREALLDHTAAQTSPLKPARRNRGWLPALSAAAIMVLAAGVVWRVAPRMWGAQDSDRSGAMTRIPVAVDAPSSQSAVNANGAMESAESAQPEKNRNAAKPGERAAAPEPPEKRAPAPASPAGGAANASDDKGREAQSRQPPSDLRRERMQPAAPSPKAAAAKPVIATPAAPAPQSGPLPESTTATARANPAPSASPPSIVDDAVNAKPKADSASAVRSEPAAVAAKTVSAAPSAQSFAQEPQAGAAAPLPLAPPANAAPASPVPAARSPEVTDIAVPAHAPALSMAPAPPPPPPALSPSPLPSPLPENISSDEQMGYQQRLQEHVAESPTHWIERIRALLQNREREEALWNLREFRKQYPAEKLPVDLRDLQ